MDRIQWAFVLFVLLMLPDSEARCLPGIYDTSNHKSKNVGDSVELACSIYCLNYPVNWKQDSKVISSGSKLSGVDSRFSIQADKERSMLQIKNLQEDDTGTYSCDVWINKTKTLWVRIDLKVKPRPDTKNPVETTIPPAGGLGDIGSPSLFTLVISLLLPAAWRGGI